MLRHTTPTPTSSDLVPPSTPGADIATNRDLPPRTPVIHADGTPAMRIQRNTPIPSTPGGHRRISSIPRTPGSSALICSSSPTSFTKITVHTAKCSECDKRNLETMLRCPGCTFQVCKPCHERREAAGRSLAHGNMITPRIATPGTSGGVVRRKPVSTLKSVMKDEGSDGRRETVKSNGKKRLVKLAPKPKATSKPEEVTPSDDSSDDDFAPDPASPTAHKRRRTALTSRFDVPSPFLRATRIEGSKVPEKILGAMTIDELLAHHGVNTPESPYTAHLLSRHEPVVSNPVIEIPAVVKRGFKPRPSAVEIQQNIQDKVKEKLALLRSIEEAESDK